MKIAAAIEKMTDFYKGNIHDIYHFLKVWAFAKNIGEAEGLDPKTQETLEMAAVVHDIACPLCREKYGNTSGKHQEEESAPLVAEFFKDVPAGELDVERITWLVTHHHTYTNVEEWITRSCWKPIFWSMPARANIQNRRLKISAEKYFGRKRERIC